MDYYTEVDIDQPFSLGTLNIDPFAISHDANEPSGYRIDNGKKAVAVATDLEYMMIIP